MNILRIGRNATIIAILLSLLFHVSTIVYIFLQKKTNPFITSEEQQLQQKELEKIQQQEEWAETKARASNFGAPVFFEDTIEEPYYAEAPKGKQEEQPSGHNDTASLQEITEPEELPEENSTAEENNPVQNILEQNAIALEAATPTPIKSPITRRLPNSSAHPEPVEGRKKRPYSVSYSTKATKDKKATKSRPQQNNYAPAPSAQKPPLSLAQLTQGFMNHLKDEGKYAVSMLGNKSGKPTEEQLKYERYLQKLGWCLQNSYNINSNRCPAIPEDTTVHVHLVLNRDGTTRNVALAKSSKNLGLDAFTMQVFRDASSSFPPVPDYLKVDPFAITYVITVGACDGRNMVFYHR